MTSRTYPTAGHDIIDKFVICCHSVYKENYDAVFADVCACVSIHTHARDPRDVVYSVQPYSKVSRAPWPAVASWQHCQRKWKKRLDLPIPVTVLASAETLR